MRENVVFALAEAVRRHNSTVIAVNRPLCPFTTILNRRHRFFELFAPPRLEQAEENLYFHSPKIFVHERIGRSIPPLESVNKFALGKSLTGAMRKTGVAESKPIVWYYYPQQGYAADIFPESFNILELKDSMTDKFGNNRPTVDRLEEAGRSRVDLLLCASNRLFEKYGKHYKNAERSFNGLDRRICERLSDPDLSPNERIARIPGPRIGYAGIISNRLNIDLIKRIAQAKPDWNFVFAGKVIGSDVRDALNEEPNIHLVGEFTKERIPSVLRAFDIGIMPYLYTEYFRCANPLKFYDFAAAGVFSVSSRMDELERFDDRLVSIVPEDVNEWIDALETGLSSTDDISKLGSELALKHTWHNLAVDLVERLSRYFQ